MRHTLPLFVKRQLEVLLAKNHRIKKIVSLIHEKGGRTLLVGGAVRDLFLKTVPKDLDIEVQGIKIDELQKILRKMGNVSLVGKTFGVLRLNGLDVDWSVPRRDSKGRKPKVEIDTAISLEDAFRRRDLTMNAMGIDLRTHELIDPFNGLQDIDQKILRVPDKELFIEDPLRFFRVMQFIGRFEMEPDSELNALCKKMDLSDLSRERIEEEFSKLFLKAERPSLGIEWLRTVGRLKEILPEADALIGIEQDKRWHPEGDVYTHTLQALDAMAALSKDLSSKKRLILLWATLCHDLGKVEKSQDWGDGKISAYGHEKAGIKPAKKLLKRITRDKQLIDEVPGLIAHHMAPDQFIKNKAKAAAYKRLALKMAPVTLEELALLSCADKLARNPRGVPFQDKNTYCKNIREFTKKAAEVGVLHKAEAPILQGKDIIDVVEPGPKMGRLLKKAYEIQIEESIKDKRELKKRVLS